MALQMPATPQYDGQAAMEQDVEDSKEALGRAGRACSRWKAVYSHRGVRRCNKATPTPTLLHR